MRAATSQGADSVLDTLRKPTEILKLSRLSERAFRVGEIDPIYLNIRGLVFNTTIPASHKA